MKFPSAEAREDGRRKERCHPALRKWEWWCILAAFLYAAEVVSGFRSPAKILLSSEAWHSLRLCSQTLKGEGYPSECVENVDVIIIGSGLAGLSCGALLSSCGRKVLVLESHDTPGGAAHSWERKGFHFESGPSLYSGLSSSVSPNPLKSVFQIIEEDCEWITYDRWGTVLPQNKGRFAAKIGPEEFESVVLRRFGNSCIFRTT
jgi:hypothetical protein